MSEAQRLESLRRLGLMGRVAEPGLDDLVDLLRDVLGADAASLTLVDAARAWPAAAAGVLPAVALERTRSAADLVLPIRSGLLWVEDATAHPRFGDHPWVRTSPGIEALAAATVSAPDGQPIGAFEVAWRDAPPRTADRDALLRRAADQLATRLELRAEAVEYRKFVELAPDAMAVLDLDGAIELCNAAFAELLGHDRSDALHGRAFLELVVPEDRDRGAAELARVLFARQRVSTIDLTLQRPGGGRLPVAVSAGHLRGARRSLQLVVRDLTERVRSESERARLTEQLAEAYRFETVGQLAGGLAHDLNNLLAVLVSNLSLADETLQDLRTGASDTDEGLASLADDLAHLRAASDRVDVLTRKLLQFASPGRTDARTVALADVAAALHDLLARSLGPEVRLLVEVDEDVPDVHLDPGELEQAITNLLLNGRDAMPGGGRLTLRVHRGGQEGAPGDDVSRTAVIEVVDEGEGMTDAVLARAFEPLFTTKSADRGTGLGLASVRAFVQRVGGSIAIDTTPGVGTCVTLTLPAAGGAPVVHPTAAAAPLVLLADPADRSRRVIAAMFEQAGYRVEEVADAVTARARLEKGPVAVLACELTLPDANGPAVIVAARLEQPDLPAVLLSSNPDVRDQIAGVPVLVKPFSSERLLETVAIARAAAGAVDLG